MEGHIGTTEAGIGDAGGHLDVQGEVFWEIIAIVAPGKAEKSLLGNGCVVAGGGPMRKEVEKKEEEEIGDHGTSHGEQPEGQRQWKRMRGRS